MRKSLVASAALALALAAGEGVARYGLGLGTPPLYQTDPALEYRMAPNQHVWRFGNLIETNERGMRSPKLAGEHRRIVLVVGDSVPNGGSQTDQAALATSLLSDDTTVFANFSAGSWGPANELAALRESEDLAPKAIVVVLNSEDLPDVPTFAPLDADHPQQTPFSALWEAVTRYLPRYMPGLGAENTQTASEPKLPNSAEWARGRADLHALLDYLKNRPQPVCVVLHPTRDEMRGEMTASNREIAATIADMGLSLVDQATSLLSAPDRGTQLYRDEIHPNEARQKWLAEAIHDCLEKSGFGPSPLPFALTEKRKTTDGL